MYWSTNIPHTGVYVPSTVLENETFYRTEETKKQQNSKTPSLCVSFCRGEPSTGEVSEGEAGIGV